MRVEELVPPDFRITLTGLSDGKMLVEDALTVSDTVPENPPRLARLIVEVPETSGPRVRVAGFADMLNGATMNGTMILCVIMPLVPVTVTLKTPVEEELQVSEDVPDEPRVMLVGLREQVGPDGETDTDNPTVPRNPLGVPTVIVEEPEPPTAEMIDEGEDARLKSGTVMVTMAERVSVPLVPVTATT